MQIIQLKIPQKKVSSEQLEKEAKEEKFRKAKDAGRQLFFLMHAQNCKRVAQGMQCKPQCASTKKLLAHLKQCKDQNCMVAHCRQSRQIVKHYQGCKRSDCPLCSFVRKSPSGSHRGPGGSAGGYSGTSRPANPYRPNGSGSSKIGQSTTNPPKGGNNAGGIEHELRPWNDNDLIGLQSLFASSASSVTGLDIDLEDDELLTAAGKQGYALDAAFRKEMEQQGATREDWEKQHCVAKTEITAKHKRATSKLLLGTT